MVGFCTEGGGVVILDRGGRTSRGDFGQGKAARRGRLVGEDDSLVAEDLCENRWSTRRGAIVRAGHAR